MEKRASYIEDKEEAEDRAYAEYPRRTLIQGYREAGLLDLADLEEEFADYADNKTTLVENTVSIMENCFLPFLYGDLEQKSFFVEGRGEELELLKKVLISKHSEDFNIPLPSETECGIVRFYATRFDGIKLCVRRIEEDKGWFLGFLRREAS